jgi:hypothetical protein
VQQYTIEDKASFLKLCMCEEALLWRENLCEGKQTLDATQAMTWDEFRIVTMTNSILPIIGMSNNSGCACDNVQSNNRCLHQRI